MPYWKNKNIVLKVIKLAFISFLILFLLVTGITLFIPSQVRISRAVNIKADSGTIIAQINDIRNWKNWYPGFDSLMVNKPLEEKGRVIFAEVKGSQIELKQDSANHVTARFNKADAQQTNMGWQVITHEGSDLVTVQWYIDFKLKWYPWEKFSSLSFEARYGSMLETGLATLKSFLEPKQ